MPHLKNLLMASPTRLNYTKKSLAGSYIQQDMRLFYGAIKPFIAENISYLGYPRTPYLTSGAKIDIIDIRYYICRTVGRYHHTEETLAWSGH